MTDDAIGQSVETAGSLSDLVAMQADDQTVDEGAEGETPEDEEAPESEGEEAPEGEDEAAESEDEATVTLKVDGKEIQVTPKQLKDYAQMGVDYTQKTQKVAEESKALEAERGRISQLQSQQEAALNQAIQQAQSFAQYLHSELGEAPGLDLAQYDPNAYIVQKAQYDQKAGKLQQVEQHIAQLQADHQRQRQGWINQQANECERVLKDTLPGWNDAKMQELHEFAVNNGIAATDTSMLSPGYWRMLNDAKAFQALKADQAKLKPAVKAPPKAIKPGNASTQTQTRQEALRKHKANPSLSSLASLMD